MKSNNITGSRKKFFDQSAYNSKDKVQRYYKSVLSPFNTEVSRGPSDFYMPTSILDYKYTFDVTFGQAAGVCVLYPHFLIGQVSANSPSWLQTQSYPNLNTSQTLGGAGINVVQSPLFGYWTSQMGSTNVNARWMSARVVRCGMRIIPQSNIQTKQGTLTIGMVPGKTENATNATNSLPSVQQLRQYPTSYEVGLATLGPTGTDYIWLPLDPQDLIFNQGSTNSDFDEYNNVFRSPIVALFTGLSINDSYHIQVSIAYEYVPVPAFESWAPIQPSSIDTTVTRNLNKLISQDIPEAVSGELGQKLFKMARQGTGQLIGSYNPVMGAAFNLMTG